MKVLRANQQEDTPAGRFLKNLYLKTNAMEVFAKREQGGFPYDGCQHSLIFFLSEQFTSEDVEAWLATIEETYGLWSGCTEFMSSVRGKLTSLRAAQCLAS